MWDVFISHAAEDKETIATPLAEALSQAGFNVWYDALTLKLGDSLTRSINRGIAESRYGIVILSRSFLEKEWPQRELDGLTTREISSGKTILPVWHNIAREEIEHFSPMLADLRGMTAVTATMPSPASTLPIVTPPSSTGITMRGVVAMSRSEM